MAEETDKKGKEKQGTGDAAATAAPSKTTPEALDTAALSVSAQEALNTAIIPYKKLIIEAKIDNSIWPGTDFDLEENGSIDGDFPEANKAYIEIVADEINTLIEREEAKTSGLSSNFIELRDEFLKNIPENDTDTRNLAVLTAFIGAAEQYRSPDESRLYLKFQEDMEELASKTLATIEAQGIIELKNATNTETVVGLKTFLNERSPYLADNQLDENDNIFDPAFLHALQFLPPYHHETLESKFGKSPAEYTAMYGLLIPMAMTPEQRSQIEEKVRKIQLNYTEKHVGPVVEDLKAGLMARKSIYGFENDIEINDKTDDSAFNTAFEKAVTYHSDKIIAGAPPAERLSGSPYIDYQAFLLSYKDQVPFDAFTPKFTLDDPKIWEAQAKTSKVITGHLASDIEALKKIKFTEQDIAKIKATEDFKGLDMTKWPDDVLKEIEANGLLMPEEIGALPYLRAASWLKAKELGPELTKRIDEEYLPYLQFMGVMAATNPQIIETVHAGIRDNDLVNLEVKPAPKDPDKPARETEEDKPNTEETDQPDSTPPTGAPDATGKLRTVTPEQAAGAIMVAQTALGFSRGDETEGRTIAENQWGKITRTTDANKPLLGNTEDPTLIALHKAFKVNYEKYKNELSTKGRENLDPEKATPNEIMYFFLDLYEFKSDELADKKVKFANLEIKHETALGTVNEKLDYLTPEERQRVFTAMQEDDGELRNLHTKANPTKDDITKTRLYKNLSATVENKSKLADDLWDIFNDPNIFSYISPPSAEAIFGESLDKSEQGLKDLFAITGLATYNATGQLPEGLFIHDPNDIPAAYKGELFDDRLFDPVVYDSLNSRGAVDAAFLTKDPALKEIMEELGLDGKATLTRQEVGKIAIERMEDIAELYGIKPENITQAISNGTYVPYFGDLELAHEGFESNNVYVPEGHKQLLADIGQNWNSRLNMKAWRDRDRDKHLIARWGEISEEDAFLYSLRVSMFTKYNLPRDYSMTLAEAREKIASEDLASFNAEVARVKKSQSIYGVYNMDAPDPNDPGNFRTKYQEKRLKQDYIDKTLAIMKGQPKPEDEATVRARQAQLEEDCKDNGCEVTGQGNSQTDPAILPKPVPKPSEIDQAATP